MNQIPIKTNLYGEVCFKNYQNNIVEVLERIIREVPDVNGFMSVPDGDDEEVPF